MPTPPEPNDSKIEAARERVREIEGEIEVVRADLNRYRIERSRLGSEPTDPDVIERATALDTAIERLSDSLPVPGAKAGEWRPPLQRDLEKAKAELEDLRRQRHNLAREVEGLEALADRLGPRLDEVRDAFTTILAALTAVDTWPPGLDARRAASFVTWANRHGARIRSLPAWRANLAEMGDDPHYLSQLPASVTGKGWR